MKSKEMLTRHILKFEVLAVAQQQRIMKRLEKAARLRAKTNSANREDCEAEASGYYHRRTVSLSRQARITNLYRAFLKGLRYSQVEQSLKPSTLPAWRLLYSGHFNISEKDLSSREWDAFSDWLDE